MATPVFPNKFSPMNGKRPMFGLLPNKKNDLFDVDYYASNYSFISRDRAYDHYYDVGVHKGFNPNAYFDTDWYLSEYDDVATSKQNPLDHYLRFGRAEGRNPSRRFSTLMYLALYPDVARDPEMNPLLHFLTRGKIESRQPVPVDFLPPSKRNEAVVGTSWLHFTKRLGIDIMLENSTDWFDRFWIWTNVRRELSCDIAQDQIVMPSSYVSVGNPNTLGQNKYGIPGDFLPSAAATELIISGLNLYLLKKNRPVIAAESGPYLIDYNQPVLPEKLERDHIQGNIGSEISVRLWRELFFVANTLNKSRREEVSITEQSTFSFAMISKLETSFPLQPSSRPLFFRILHADLVTFVSNYDRIAGEWGSLRREGEMLILAA